MALSPYQMMLSQRYSMVPEQPMTVGGGSFNVQPVPVMGSGAPEDAILRARRMLKETLGGARQGIDPRMAAILDRRAQRLDTQEQQLARSSKPNVADTLTRIGTALMANQSPFFGVALGNALNQNLQQQQAARMQALRQRMALDESRDELDMERLNQEGAGRKEAMAELNTVLGLAKTIGGIEGDQLEAAARRIAIENAPEEAAAKLKLLEAQIYQTRTAATENLAQAAAAGRSNRGDGGISPVEARGDRNELDKASARYRGAAARYEALRAANPGATMQQLREADPKTVDDYLSGRAELEGLSGAFERRYGATPYIGGRRPSVGALTPSRTVRPGAANLQDPLGIRR